MKNYIYITLLVSLILNGYLVALLFNRPTPETKTEIVRTVDTLHHTKEIHLPVHLPGAPIITERLDTLYIRDTLEVVAEDVIQRRVYADSIEQDGAKLHYTHSVIGIMEASRYSFSIPERTIIDRETSSSSQSIEPRWELRLMGGLNYTPAGSGFTMGAGIHYKDIGAYYLYDPWIGGHQMGVSARLWRRD